MRPKANSHQPKSRMSFVMRQLEAALGILCRPASVGPTCSQAKRVRDELRFDSVQLMRMRKRKMEKLNNIISL